MIGDDRQLFLQLPLTERTIAVALKHLFDQIKTIEEQEGQEIQKIHQQFIGKFKQVETKSSKIIKGGPITVQDLQDKQSYLQSDEINQVEALIKGNNRIQAYWIVVFQNYFQQKFTPADREIATAILDIATNVTEDKLELVFEIASNPWLAAGKYSKTLILKDGVPEKMEGSKVNWLKKQPEGILVSILKENLNPEELNDIFPVFGDIINEIVPYSLEFFLGYHDHEGQSEDSSQEDDEDDEDQQQDEDQEDGGPNKKVKL